jgi:hypothetical protein
MHTFVDFFNGFPKGNFNMHHILTQISTLPSIFNHFVQSNRRCTVRQHFRIAHFALILLAAIAR